MNDMTIKISDKAILDLIKKSPSKYTEVDDQEYFDLKIKLINEGRI